MPTESAETRIAMILTYRLVTQYELTPQEAATAVYQLQRKQNGPHTHLVIAEAMRLLHDTAKPLQAAIEGLRAVLLTAGAAMAEHARTTSQPPAPDRRMRAAWISPYGPTHRRRGQQLGKESPRAR